MPKEITIRVAKMWTIPTEFFLLLSIPSDPSFGKMNVLVPKKAFSHGDKEWKRLVNTAASILFAMLHQIKSIQEPGDVRIKFDFSEASIDCVAKFVTAHDKARYSKIATLTFIDDVSNIEKRLLFEALFQVQQTN